MGLLSLLVFFLLAVGFSSGHLIKRAVPSFEQGVITGTVSSSHIDEASGLAASRKHPDVFYTHNDHGGDAEIFAISSSGHLRATYKLHGVTSNDWEDIAVGPCNGQNINDHCIYISDTGDGGDGALNNVYRFAEPDSVHDQTITVDNSNKLHFSWGEKDCETLMVDPAANVYIISKVDGGHGVIAKLDNSAWGTNNRDVITSRAILNIPSTSHNDPLGGDISRNGNEVLVKTREAIYYWNTAGSPDYVTLLQTPGTKLPYIKEHRGESVCWDATGSGYYTLGEGHHENVYHYARSAAVVG